MPPPCSTRWNYFTKGAHPSPPASDGRTAGTPHTPIHPCSNPKLFWVQCNFCIAHNGGNLVDDEKAWMKSREEQMMHHLKNCCKDSQQVWEDIIAWKARRKGMDVEEMAAGKKRDKKRDNACSSPSSNGISNINSGTKSKSSSKKARRSTTTAKKTDAGEAVSLFPGTPSSASPARLSSSEHTKLNSTQLRYFHKVCTIATATRKLDFSFFEDPMIMEIFHVVRPALVANGQLPNEQLIVGTGNGSTMRNFIEKYAVEQITNDMYRIVRSLNRYDGLKAAVVCTSFADISRPGETPPSTLLCGGDLSCRVVPEMQKEIPQSSLCEVEVLGTNGVRGCSTSSEHAAIVLANTFEAQLRMTATILGKSIEGDEHALFNSQPGNDSDMKAAAAAVQATNSISNQDQCIDENKINLRHFAGLSHIGSCLLATTFHEGRAALAPSVMRRVHRILSYRWPMIFFTSCGCLEEQLNLLFKDVLTKIPIEAFQEPMEHACATIGALRQLESSGSTKKWYDSLLKCVDETYGIGQCQGDIAKDLLGAQKFILFSCWAPAQRALASLLRIKTSLGSFAEEHSEENDFPDALCSLADNVFWEKVQRAEAFTRPLARATLKFAPEKGTDSSDNKRVAPTLADMVHTFYALHYSWAKAGFEIVPELVENRWRQYEHPWMMLAFVLHPGYTREAKCFLKKQSREDGLFSAKYLSNAVLGYTVKYLAPELAGENPLSIPLLKRQTSEYLDRIEQGEVDSEASVQMQKDWKEYWNYQTSTPELSTFALFILSVPVQSMTVEDMFLGYASQCAQITTKDDQGFFYKSAQRVKLKEHLGILERAAKPIVHKWQQKGVQRSKRQTIQIMSPVERIPVAPVVATGTSANNGGAIKTSRSVGKNEQVYDAERMAKETLEERVVAGLATMNSKNDGTGVNRNGTVVQFWITVLNELGEVEEKGYEDAVKEKQVDGFTEVAGGPSSPQKESDDDGEDGDLPQFTVPAYAQTNTASRKVRRTYRPEQINFDFMKGWTDTRDQSLLSTESSPQEENVSQLKNYRANKIRLSDFFLPLSHASLDEALVKCDDEDQS